MTKYSYQYRYSELHSEPMYDSAAREQKAKKMLAVLDDFYSGRLNTLSALDIGCSTGIIANTLSHGFKNVIGIDIDKKAVEHAKDTYRRGNLEFYIQDSMDLAFPSGSFDVVICAHIYEHVPDYNRLMSEIYRVLKPGGVCYFAAGNRLSLIEPHYKLPLLSMIPKAMAHAYLRFLKKGDFYYENHLTLWGLRRLVARFEIIDYTEKIIADPQKYFATELVQDKSVKQKIARLICKLTPWFCPTYIWLLCKKS